MSPGFRSQARLYDGDAGRTDFREVQRSVAGVGGQPAIARIEAIVSLLSSDELRARAQTQLLGWRLRSLPGAGKPGA